MSECRGSNVYFGVGDQMSILVSGIKSPGIKCPGIKCPFLGWGSKVRGSNVRGSNVHFGVGDQKSGDQMSILGSGIKRHQDQMSILCRGSNVLGIECPRDQLSTHFMGSKIRNQKSGDQKSGDQVSITHQYCSNRPYVVYADFAIGIQLAGLGPYYCPTA